MHKLAFPAPAPPAALGSAAELAPAPPTGCDSEYAGADGAPPAPPRRQRNKPWTQADYAQTYSAVLACGLQPGSARMSSAAASGTAAVGEADDNLCGGEEHAAHAEPMPAGMGTGKRRRRGDADTEGGAAQRKGNVCPHNCEKSQCKECGGSGLCPHQRRRRECKECGGARICPHQRIRSTCKECGGASICPHQRQRSHCKECGGASICQHQRRRSQCKECGGASICQHQRRRSRCKECRSEADESMPDGLEELEDGAPGVGRAGRSANAAASAQPRAPGRRQKVVKVRSASLCFMCVCVCVCVSVRVCLSVCPSVCLSVCLSIGLRVSFIGISSVISRYLCAMCAFTQS